MNTFSLSPLVLFKLLFSPSDYYAQNKKVLGTYIKRWEVLFLSPEDLGTYFQNEIRNFLNNLEFSDVPSPGERLFLGGQEKMQQMRFGKEAQFLTQG